MSSRRELPKSGITDRAILGFVIIEFKNSNLVRTARIQSKERDGIWIQVKFKDV